MPELPAPRRPTLRDVAARAGVSFKTVSRVVNGEGGVSDELARRVDEAIATLGYQPDDRARRLRSGGSRTGAIGFVLVDVANPFFGSILRGIEESARRHGYVVLSGSTDGDPERQDMLVGEFVERRVDGLIVVPSGDSPGALRPELERATPLVFVDLEIDGIEVDIVRSDHEGGARLATRHLIEHGHRDIAFLGDDARTFSAWQRRDGFRAEMRDHGLPVPDHRIISARRASDAWHHTAVEYLGGPTPPSAVVTAQNFVTIGVTRALHELGREHTIAQVGFDDVDLSDLVSPGITVVPQQPRELGRAAAERLFGRIDGDTSAPWREILPPSLIVRGSGEIAPGG